MQSMRAGSERGNGDNSQTCDPVATGMDDAVASTAAAEPVIPADAEKRSRYGRHSLRLHTPETMQRDLRIVAPTLAHTAWPRTTPRWYSSGVQWYAMQL